VFVDTGMKIDAVVDRSELLDADQKITFAEGDELELYVAAVVRAKSACRGPFPGSAGRKSYAKRIKSRRRWRQGQGDLQGRLPYRHFAAPGLLPDQPDRHFPVPDPAVHVGQPTRS